MKKKNFLIFSSFFFPLLLAAGFVFARELEVPLPSIGGEGITETPLLPDYVKYLFNFAIGIAGLIAFISAVYGGFKHLISAGSPSAMEDANDQIFAGVLGLVVIIGSWLILTTINPQLVIINPQIVESGLTEEEAPGIYLCKSETECYHFSQSTAYVGSAASNATSLRIVNPSDSTEKYSVVLHGDKSYRGKCAVYLDGNTSASVSAYSITGIGGVNSITVFKKATFASGQGVTLYEKEDYNQRCGAECYQQCPIGGKCEKCFCYGPYISNSPNLNKTGRSISIDGKYLAVVFEKPSYSGLCGVFTVNDPNLSASPIGVCAFASDVGCFGSIMALPVK